jgi:hypothetical protein
VNRIVQSGLGVGAAVVLALAPAVFLVGGFVIGLLIYNERRKRKTRKPAAPRFASGGTIPPSPYNRPMDDRVLFVIPPPNFDRPTTWYDERR